MLKTRNEVRSSVSHIMRLIMV